ALGLAPVARERRPHARAALEVGLGQPGDLLGVGVDLEGGRDAGPRRRELAAAVLRLRLELRAYRARPAAAHGSLPGGVYPPPCGRPRPRYAGHGTVRPA